MTTMTVVAVVLIGLMLLLQVLLVLGFRHLATHPLDVAASEQAAYNDLAGRVAQLEITVRGLPSLWEEERERAVRASERARVAAYRAAQRAERLQDDEDELPPGDGSGGGEGGLQALPSRLEGPSGPPLPEHVRRAQALGYPFAFLGKPKEG